MKKALILSLFLLSGCATAPPADDGAAIDDLIQRWQAAMRKGDARAVAALVTEDAELWAAGAPPLIGREAVRKRYDDFFKQYSLEQTFVVAERVMGRDHVVLRGLETNNLTEKTTRAKATAQQRAISIARRDRDGRWRFARTITNLASRPGAAQ